METKAKVLGVTDEVCTCDCCGRTDLKRTVVLDFDGSVRYFGCECASRALGRRTSKGLMKQAEAAQSAVDQKAAAAKFFADFLADQSRLTKAFESCHFAGSFDQFVEQQKRFAAEAMAA